jgi:two-component sensor histidine kinase
MINPPVQGDEQELVVEASSNEAERARSELSERRLRMRIRQQEILAELGVLALQGTPFTKLIQHTVAMMAEGMEAEFCKILQYLPGEERFLLQAGVGWNDELIGSATIGADVESPAGFALKTGKPVISNHLEDEDRFRTPELLLQYGIRRAVNVILQGDETAYGVLEVDSKSEGDFTENDLSFLQGAANILGMAIERQRYERDLRAAVERYEVLMQEVNHRVNNSLQLVMSMLKLQADAANAPDLQDQLIEAASRISAIARAHQRLYRTGHVQRVDLGAYLTDVCHDLDDLADCEVELNVAQGISVAIDRAIPISLLVNELVTNAAKHAYAGKQGSRIWVSLAPRETESIVLTVRDEGIGLPPDFDPNKRKGLGMRIINAFSQQLGTSMQIRAGNPGTEFILVVPIEPAN